MQMIPLTYPAVTKPAISTYPSPLTFDRHNLSANTSPPGSLAICTIQVPYLCFFPTGLHERKNYLGGSKQRTAHRASITVDPPVKPSLDFPIQAECCRISRGSAGWYAFSACLVVVCQSVSPAPSTKAVIATGYSVHILCDFLLSSKPTR